MSQAGIAAPKGRGKKKVSGERGFGAPVSELTPAERATAITGYDLRSRIEALIAGVTGKTIKTVFYGSGAWTTKGILAVPSIPQLHMFTRQEAMVLLGYTAHEISHQLETDFDIISSIFADVDKPTKEEKQLKEWWNAIEDYRIEKISKREYPGFPIYIGAVRHHTAQGFVDRVKEGKIPADMLSNPYRIGAVGLTWVGAKLNGYPTTAHDAALDSLDPTLGLWLRSLSPRLALVEKVEDSLNLAKELLEELAAASTGQQGDQGDQGDQDQNDRGQQGQQGQGQQGPSGQSDADEGDSSAQSEGASEDNQASDPSREDASDANGDDSQDAGGNGEENPSADTDSAPSEDEQGRGSDDGEDQSDDREDSRGDQSKEEDSYSEDDEGSGDPDGSAQDHSDDGEQDQSGAADQSQGQGQGQDKSDAEDAAEEGSAGSTTQSGGEDSGEQDSSSGQDADASESDVDGQESGEDSPSGSKNRKSPSGGNNVPVPRATPEQSEADAEESDLSIDEILDILSKMATQLDNAETSIDEQVGGVESEVVRRSQQKYAALKRNLGSPAARTAGVVRRLLISQQKTRTRRNLEEGRLDLKRLVPIVSGSPNVYYQKSQRKDVNSAVYILLDNSGSMGGEPLTICQKTAIVLDAAISGTDTDLEIAGFTGSSWKPTIYRYRRFGQRGQAAAASLGSMDEVSLGGTPAAIPILEAHKRLREHKAPRKILIVVSDGGAEDNERARQAHDIAVVTGCIVLGLGIGPWGGAIAGWCDNHQVIEDIAELPNALAGIVQNALITNRRKAA